MGSQLFALDIGTRSVVGIILEEEQGTYTVRHLIVKEHEERAMVDGQIHNVLLVADVIRSIREELEAVYGPLTSVSVAAAGRALRTEQAALLVDLRNRPVLSEEDIGRLEIECVQKAQEQLSARRADAADAFYYCVGYSVLYYRLDGQEMGSLVDQQGEQAAIEVIATFLPRVVVESLIAALARAGLEMEALTLEPIAAINVLIPPSMRRLNVALVDIGAGTSDIAITDKGTVVAYGMVATAGDEITEALSDHYLLDFHRAETIKRQLATEREVSIQDILGFERSASREEVVSALDGAVGALASSIREEIFRLNSGVAPKAVMLVGGGSLTPGITGKLADALGLPPNRVAVRGLDALQHVAIDRALASSPELVTPIGIAIAARKSPIQYMAVRVNGQTVRFFELKEMAVGDALLAAHIQARQLYGRPGLALSILLNGRDVHIPGRHGEPATLLRNGEKATVKTPIQAGDHIEVVPGRDGAPGRATVADLLDGFSEKSVLFNGRLHVFAPSVAVNGKPAHPDRALVDRDDVQVKWIETVGDALDALGIESEALLSPYSVIIEGRSVSFPAFSPLLLQNGLATSPQSALADGDELVVESGSPPSAATLLRALEPKGIKRLTVSFQGVPHILERPTARLEIQGVEVAADRLVPSGSKVKIVHLPDEPFCFQDIFSVTDWTPPRGQGSMRILKNGRPASLLDPIQEGDALAIEAESN